MENQELKLELNGLYTSPNLISAVPDGALVVAENVVLDRFNVIQSRRGQKQYGDPIETGLGKIEKIFNYKTDLYINYNNRMAYDSGNGVWVQYDGYYSAPNDQYRMTSLEQNKNSYFTSSSGIQKIDLISNNPRQAGIVPALSGTATLSGSSGFLLNDSAVNYRIMWSYIDVNNNLIRSAPSSILTVRNSTGGDRDVSLTFVIPDTITTEYKYGIFRSLGTLSASDEPGDNLQLIIEDNPTPDQITNKSFTVLDTMPYSGMGEVLYTSEDLEGISQANFEPPLCTDMDLFKDCVFYGGITQQKEQQTITLLTAGLPGLGYVFDNNAVIIDGSTTILFLSTTVGMKPGMLITSPGYLQDNTILTRIVDATTVRISKPAIDTGAVQALFSDVVIIDDITYIAGPSNNPATNTFKVEDGYTPGDNVFITANNLVEVINTSTTNTGVYASYASFGDDLPGRISIFARQFGTDAFQVLSSAGTSFIPNLTYSLPITGIALGTGPRVTTLTTSNLTSGDTVTITGSNSTPSLNGDWLVDVVNDTQFDIVSPSITITNTGNTGTWLAKNKLVLSTKEENINRVYVSKPSQPEAVPLLNFFPVGSANYAIDRVIALRDGIFFLKQDGIFRTSGNTIANFNTTLIDKTAVVNCPESAVVGNNQIFAMTTQGMCAISDAGVRIISIPIEDQVLFISSERFENFRDNSFGVFYESDRQYIFFTVESPLDTCATIAYVFNYVTETFTKWRMNRTCGIVNAFTRKLFMAKKPQDGYSQVMVERKTMTTNDFADEQFNVDITQVIDSTHLELSSVFNVEEDMTIQQGLSTDGYRAVIIDVVGNIITLAEESDFFQVGEAEVYRPILNKLTWAPIAVGNPGIFKDFTELTLAFQKAVFTEIDIGYSTEVFPTSIHHTLPNQATTFAWGGPPWGDFPWGGTPSNGQTFIRDLVPKPMKRCITLNLSLQLNEAFKGFQLQGVSLWYENTSSRFRGRPR